MAAATLGLLAFAADYVDGITGRVMIVLVSSGLAWGLAALLSGRTAPDRRAAVVGATALLVVATLVYYLLILLVSRRWSGGSLPDGSSTDWNGLLSVAVTTAAWLLISVVAGPALGLLGHLTRSAPVPRAALAAGVACGLLSGQGWQEIATTPTGHLRSFGGPEGISLHEIGAPVLVEVILPLAVLTWLATRRRLWPAWPLLLTATVVTATLSAVSWQMLRVVANRFG